MEKHSPEYNENNFQLPIEAGEVSEYAQAISDFDACQHSFLNATISMTQRPFSVRRQSALMDSVQDITSAFDTCIHTIHQEVSDTAERTATITGLIIGEERQRLKAWSTSLTHVDPKKLNRYKHDLLAGAIQTAYTQEENTDEVMQEVVTNIFRTGIHKDLEAAILMLPETTESLIKNERRARQLDVAKTVGRHALDAAKIGLGVAGGIIAARFMRKRNQ